MSFKSILTKTIGLPRILLMLAGLLLLGLVIYLNHPASVTAAPADLAGAEARYPNIVGSRIDTCTLCHTSPPILNPYGSAYKAAGRNSAALAAIESLDSDGDGWTNIQEIMALTFPGDPNDVPVPTATPTVTRTPFQPPSSTPTATLTLTATSTNTPLPGVSPTATNTPVPVIRPTDTNTPTATATNAGLPEPSKTPRGRPTRTPTATMAPGTNPSPTPTTICQESDDDEAPNHKGDDSGRYSFDNHRSRHPTETPCEIEGGDDGDRPPGGGHEGDDSFGKALPTGGLILVIIHWLASVFVKR